MTSKGTKFSGRGTPGKVKEDDDHLSGFLGKLEKIYGTIPEIYLKSNKAGNISDIQYFDFSEGEYHSLKDPGWKINGLLPKNRLNDIFDELIEKQNPDNSYSEQIQLLVGDCVKFFETRISLISGKYLIILLRDITEKKIIQENVLKLQHALNSAGDALLITDREGIITQVNPAFLKLYGYEENEIIGKVTPRILKSNSVTNLEYKEFWDTLISKKGVKMEIKNKTKDGLEVYVEGTADPILNNDGEIIGFLEIQRDITERKISENELKKSELRFRSIWEKSFDGMRLTDKNGKIVSVNKAFCNLVDMKQEELINQSFNIIYKLSKKEREEKLKEYKNVFTEKKFVNFRWSNFLLHNGKSVFFNVSFSFIDFDDESLVLSIFRDVTKYKKSEEELRNAERLAAIGTMAAYLSHEIKNPLATIKNYVEILFEDEQLTEDVKKPLQVIHDTVKNLNKLLTDVLQYARSEELIEVEIELKVMIDNVIELLKKKLGKKKIIVENKTRNLTINGDYMSMTSVFTNLIENSIEAIDENGKIEITGGRNKYFCFIEIKDNGCGIEANKKIFDPFVTTKSTGTGLGLAIVDKIMKYHNGKVELKSSKPGETIFELQFFNKGANGKNTDNRR